MENSEDLNGTNVESSELKGVIIPNKMNDAQKSFNIKNNESIPNISIIPKSNIDEESLFIDNKEMNKINNIDKENHESIKDESEKDDSNSDNEDNEEAVKSSNEQNDQAKDDSFVRLIDEPSIDDNQIQNIEINLEKIKEYDQDDQTKFKEIENDDKIDFADKSTLDFFTSLNFILSDNTKQRLNLLYFCIKHGFHILIPGPTGTGKTYLSEAICNLLEKNLIKYNCSENTKFPNLKFTCQGDKNRFAGIKYIEGPLLQALKKNNSVFLLDEANLAPIEVLQALEAMIDCGFLIYEDKGKLKKIVVPEDFCFILTLNPSKGKFSGTRQELPESFKNKFISIEFPEMKKEELFAIAEGASKAFGVDKKLENFDQFIDDFISFHMEWSKNEKIQDDVACLVIRDILAVLNIINEGEDPTYTIMNIYGARYTEDIKKEMKKVLFKYESFQNYNSDEEEKKIKETFPKDLFLNKNTIELLSTCVFSLKHGRYPIIAGNSGTGKKLLACKLADYFNEYIADKYEDNKENNDRNKFNPDNNSLDNSEKINEGQKQENVYIVYCTKSSKVEDLIGKQRISNNKSEDLIKWQDGPLIKAIKEGKPLILLGIHELQSSVLEFMNDILDRKYDGKDRYLNNPNNPNEQKVYIHKNFRLICTTLLSDINKLSPAFATRMDIKIQNT